MSEVQSLEAVKNGRNIQGQFSLGNCANPKGRPRRPEIEELRDALQKAKSKHGKDFLQHFVERAFYNDAVAIALAKKLIPDKIQGEGFGDNYRIQLFEHLDVGTIRSFIARSEKSISQQRPS